MRFVSLFLLLLLWCAPVFGAKTVEPAKLAQAIAERVDRVAEFKFLREEAAKMGVKVYLFGGTAASFSHYVREDLLREAGDKTRPDFHFDYDYLSIFRSTQDLDIVVDGTASQAEALEAIVKKKFPPLGKTQKNVWEMRPLREARGEKEKLLDNPDFYNQNTESHSTGLVEVSEPEPSAGVVKDLLDWKSPEPQFLRDVANVRLHFYLNPLHHTTNRAAQGLNPPIFGAIRFLSKAFQFGLEIDPKDLEAVRKIVKEFNPQSIDGDYLKFWIEKNAKKLVTQSSDVERSMKILDQLGLSKKLIAIKNNAGEPESLSWWLSKKPLVSFPLGKGHGRTARQLARELGLPKLIVTHESNSFASYENITHSPDGKLNAFISRREAAGEEALYGEGFYVKIGREGAANGSTGYSIRMELLPDAVEGVDFEYHPGKGFLTILNKEAVRVIPEQLDLSLVDHFKNLAAGNEWSKDDRALIEIFRRKKSSTLSAADEKAIYKMVKEAAPNFSVMKPLLKEWFALPFAHKYPDIPETLLKNPKFDAIDFVNHVLSRSEWIGREDWIKEIMRRDYGRGHIILSVLSNPEVKNFRQLALKLWEKEEDRVLILQAVMSQPHSAQMADLIDQAISEPFMHSFLFEYTLKEPHWRANPKWDGWVEEILSQGKQDDFFVQYIVDNDTILKHPEWIERVMNRGGDVHYIQHINFTLSQPASALHPEWLEKLSRMDGLNEAFDEVMEMPHWKNSAYAKNFEKTHGVKFTIANLRRVLNGRQPVAAPIHALDDLADAADEEDYKPLSPSPNARTVAANPLAPAQPVSIPKPTKKEKALAKKIFKRLPDLVKFDQELEYFFSRPVSANYPEFVEILVKKKYNAFDWQVRDFILAQPHWKNHPKLMEVARNAPFGDKSLTVDNLRWGFTGGQKIKPEYDCRSFFGKFLDFKW